jgi:hypothetical protein
MTMRGSVRSSRSRSAGGETEVGGVGRIGMAMNAAYFGAT